MRFYTLLTLGIATLLVTSCSETNYKFKLDTTKKTTLGQKAAIKFEQLNGDQIDSVQLYINNKRVNKNESSVIINTADFGVGKHEVTALAFYPNKSKKLNNSIEVLAQKAPVVYSYKLLNTYPHDKEAYTQGLEYKDGYLYESTGRRGQSTLRKVEIKTGKVLQKIDLDAKYFGEGMTIFNNKIYWLTWQARKGFIYDLETFKQLGSFNYDNSNEGWGLTHSDSELIKTDGTNKIWFLNPENQQEKRNIQVYTHDRALDKLNEIEYINGKIFSNYWKTDGKVKSTIAIIDPNSGVVEGLIGLDDLRNIILKEQTLDQDEVLNGIAYDAENNRLFVTGKHWGKLFEIELIKQ
ncbi:glutaminyl-peptide cyclotransferase [Tenacibaculum sp. 47A_GOM-205m]|uniref:glutaminyl-peptide cyclotransferase n=1 Tax=Tenacibaculum sp. 47A_GOM-205m TaxID=1380384 RepID=UPI00048E2F54|nr:glutaminyl-peptide cyclotransferase [Tenacibaculum sp. 47A_GOM-205m]